MPDHVPARALGALAFASLLAACQHTGVTPSPAAAPPQQAAGQATSPVALNERALQRRAVEAMIWGVPAVNFQLMYDALKKAGGDGNQIVYWSRLPDWRNQTLTPNPDVIYVMPFYDTRQGPVVLEIPPAAGGQSITGSVDDGWQTAIEDVGPAGVDKGRGGKYLILPPGYKGKVPAGYIAMPSSTYAGYALLRSNIGSGSEADVAKASAYARRIRIHPLSQAGVPSQTRFIDAAGQMFDSIIPYDVRFYEALDRFVQREPWIERDRVMIDMLRTSGIEKGKPFMPDDATRAALNEAATAGRAWLDASYEAGFAKPYFNGSRWALPVDPAVVEGLASNYGTTDSYPVGGRGMTYTFGFFSAKHLGQGQFYLLAIADKSGAPLEGGRTYRLRVPPKAPVKLYWSATAYDRATHTLIRDAERASRASNSQGLQRNADGSADIYFGPTAPAGMESNWVATGGASQFEVLFRLYGPEQAFFDKTWVLPDLERQ